jgi:hypothetical protein
MLGMFAGSFAGSYVPLLWGASAFSVTSILLGAIGGFLGIWLAYKLASRLGID